MRKILKAAPFIFAGGVVVFLIAEAVQHTTVGCGDALYWSTLDAAGAADHYDADDIQGSLKRIARTEKWAQSQPRCIRNNYLNWTAAERGNLADAGEDRLRKAQARIDSTSPTFPKPPSEEASQ